MMRFLFAFLFLPALLTADHARGQNQVHYFYNARIDCDSSFAYRTYFTEQPFIVIKGEDIDRLQSELRDTFDLEIRQADDAGCDYKLLGPTYNEFDAQNLLTAEKLELATYVDIVFFQYPPPGSAGALRQQQLLGQQTDSGLPAADGCDTSTATTALDQLLSPSQRGRSGSRDQYRPTPCPPGAARN